MNLKEKIKLFNEKYEKQFDKALQEKNKEKARQIIEEWQNEYNEEKKYVSKKN